MLGNRIPLARRQRDVGGGHIVVEIDKGAPPLARRQRVRDRRRPPLPLRGGRPPVPPAPPPLRDAARRPSRRPPAEPRPTRRTRTARRPALRPFPPPQYRQQGKNCR